MNNKVANKQIPLETIVKVANYLEVHKANYDKEFELEENKNRNLPYGEKNWKYENGNTTIKYTIEFKNGKNITENDYNWFVGNLNCPQNIKSISIDLYISFYTKGSNNTINDVYNKINVSLYFREIDVTIDVNTTNQENEAHNLYSEVMNILEENEDRYNKTIKYRNIRIQCFTISIGIILSYILYVILKINLDKIPVIFVELLRNKYVLVFGQWFIAILLGNIFSYWYILSLYKSLLPETKYIGYNYSTNRGNYTDDIDDYVEHSEVHFGKYWGAENRRNKIEKIYKVAKIILIAQLVISIILFLVLK